MHCRRRSSGLTTNRVLPGHDGKPGWRTTSPVHSLTLVVTTALSGRRSRLPRQCQRLEFFGKPDQAGGGCVRGGGFGHLPIFVRPVTKLIGGQEIERHMIWHLVLPHGPVEPDLSAGTITVPRARDTDNSGPLRIIPCITGM
jgi:hypothetical protein